LETTTNRLRASTRNRLAQGVTLSLTLGLLSSCRPSAPGPLQPGKDFQPPASRQASPAAKAAALKPVNFSPDAPTDPGAVARVQAYLGLLGQMGSAPNLQGVWVQTPTQLLAQHQGSTPLSAASLTKVATSLAVLKKFGANHRFITQLGTTGPGNNGVVEGDLVVQGAENPLFVWEEAIALGNALNQLGIRQVKGNLVVVGEFYMNFEEQPLTAGGLLKQGLDSRSWGGEVAAQFGQMPAGTAKPTLAIAGGVKVAPTPPSGTTWRLRHGSQPLVELVKKMNQYSNNPMAEMLAKSAGGASLVAQTAAQVTGLPQGEVQLINGSGLGPENRISPRLVCSLFQAIAQLLQAENLTLGDAFAVIGKDEGILDTRGLPPLLIVKSGTLNAVSALAGVMPTQTQGPVWFVAINGGSTNVEAFRNHQEGLTRGFLQDWGAQTALAPAFAPTLSPAQRASVVEPMP
jgi:serine-type D-Ala-D-Ala carboxypeptidase/endopeptidase (penicillin-binding protein 4)